MNIDPQTIELDEQQKAELAAISKQVGKPWSAVFSEALEAYRRETLADGRSHESVLEAAARLGLVGCVRSGIPDLTTNPAHMEGFGRDDR